MSGSIRLFVESALDREAEVTATEGQAHYLGGVMRRTAGDTVLLFNGRDGEWRARIGALHRGRAVFAVEERTRVQQPEPDTWLLFAPLKRDATDLVVQKATELGVSRLQPVFTERTNAARVNPDRLRAITIEAAEQCERLGVPALHAPAALGTLLDTWPDGRLLVAAAERAEAPPVPASGGRPAALLVGPEGGFTTGELDGLRTRPFVVLASLGPRVLRADTAAIAGLVLLHAGLRR